MHPVPAEAHAAARSMKLLAKIPKDAEATVVLVGKLRAPSLQFFPYFVSFSGPKMMFIHHNRIFQ